MRRHPLSNIDDGLEPHVIHASLYRPVLFAGADPAAVILEVATAFALVFGVGIHIVTLALATFYLTVVHALMVWIAKRDTDMIGLYIRSLSGHDYYLPHAGIHGRAPSPKSSIPSAN